MPIVYGNGTATSWNALTSTTFSAGPWLSLGASLGHFRTSMATLANRARVIPTEERIMNTPITEVEGITGLSAGIKVLVRQEGVAEPVVWVADGGNGFTNDGVNLPASAFLSAIDHGNVFLQGRYAVGDTFAADPWYYKILDVDGDGWVMAMTDSTAACRHSSIIHGQPPMNARTFPMPRAQIAAHDLLAKVWEGEKANARLAQVIESGQVPVETEYTVTVEVKGETEVTPTNAQIKRMMGDNDATIVDVPPIRVAYTKTVQVTKTALWGCACEQVAPEDLNEHVAELARWKVTGCVPVEGESTVHVA